MGTLGADVFACRSAESGEAGLALSLQPRHATESGRHRTPISKDQFLNVVKTFLPDSKLNPTSFWVRVSLMIEDYLRQLTQRAHDLEAARRTQPIAAFK